MSNTMDDNLDLFKSFPDDETLNCDNEVKKKLDALLLTALDASLKATARPHEDSWQEFLKIRRMNLILGILMNLMTTQRVKAEPFGQMIN